MRAIDGEELMDRVDFILSRVKTPEIVSVFQKLKSYLEKAPTLTIADLRPKGRWKDGECTNCGCDALYHKGVPVPTYTEFYPSCGADMRGGGEDEC